MVRTSLPSVSLLWPPKLLYSSPHFPAGDQVQTTPHSSRVHSLDTWFLFTPPFFPLTAPPHLTRPGLYLTATIPTPTLQLQSFPLDSGRTWTAVPVRPLGHHFHSLLWFSSHLSLKDRPQMSSSGNLVLLPPSELAQPPPDNYSYPVTLCTPLSAPSCHSGSALLCPPQASELLEGPRPNHVCSQCQHGTLFGTCLVTE